VVNGFVFGCGDRRLALVASTLGRRRPSTAFCVCLLAMTLALARVWLCWIAVEGR